MAIIYTNQSSGAIRRLRRRKPTKAYLEGMVVSDSSDSPFLAHPGSFPGEEIK